MTRFAPFGWMASLVIGCVGCSAGGSGDQTGEMDPGANGLGGDLAMTGSGGADVGSSVGGNGGAAERDGAANMSASGGGGKGGSGNGGGAGGGKTDGGASDGTTSKPGIDASAIGYNPCPPKGTACVVMPLGDSITYGDGSTNHAGWRAPLFHLALTNQQSVTFVGGMSDGPDTVDGVPFPKHHEGHSGYEIDGVAGFAAQALAATHPQIVLMMLGTNDIAFGFDVPNAPVRLGKLMDIVTGTDPKLLLIVAQIVPSQDDPTNVQVQALNAAIPALVKSRADAGAHIRMVDMYGALTSNPNYKTDFMFNKYHPNDAGYVKMAETWYAELGNYLR